MTTAQEKKYGFWNWGTGITIFIIAACSAIVFMVYKTTTYHFDMVETDYYSQELKFNDQVQAKRNAKQLSDQMHISNNNDFLIISFPKEMQNQKIEGKVLLYKASDASKDVELPIQLVQENVMAIDQKQLVKGWYNVKASFDMNGKSYIMEQEYQVN